MSVVCRTVDAFNISTLNVRFKCLSVSGLGITWLWIGLTSVCDDCNQRFSTYSLKGSKCQVHFGQLGGETFNFASMVLNYGA